MGRKNLEPLSCRVGMCLPSLVSMTCDHSSPVVFYSINAFYDSAADISIDSRISSSNAPITNFENRSLVAISSKLMARLQICGTYLI